MSSPARCRASLSMSPIPIGASSPLATKPFSRERRSSCWQARLGLDWAGYGLALGSRAPGGLIGGLGRPRIAEDAHEIGLADQHLPRLGALVAGNHSAALEHVDKPPGARVSDA